MYSTLRSSSRLTSRVAHSGRRSMQSAATTSRKEGDISSVFGSLNGAVQEALPARFAELKQRLVAGNEAALRHAWDELLPQLRREVAEIKALGPAIVPELDFKDIGRTDGNNEEFRRRLKRTGVAVIRGVVSEAEALRWKAEIRAYIARNPQTKAFPPDDPQVYELYWSPSQIQARGHPNLLATQAFLMSFWHSTVAAATDPAAHISTAHPVSYADRLRIRNPGDNRFALGPHCDGGSVERWEEHGYGLGGVYDSLFHGQVEKFDAWESSCRLKAVSDNYQGPGACSMFRMFQGWLSMSATAPGEGTLQVNPLFDRATAYYMLRPFFEARKPRDALSAAEFLAPENWALKTQQDSSLHGAYPGQCLELSDALHPHLELASSMVNIPAVRPGDYVAWHCDTIHAVDQSHAGAADSSVLYIPATPLTDANAEYLARQRASFERGVPPPDFPGGVGEEGHVGRATAEGVGREGLAGRRAMGGEGWAVEGSGGERRLAERANERLGF